MASFFRGVYTANSLQMVFVEGKENSKDILTHYTVSYNSIRLLSVKDSTAVQYNSLFTEVG